MNTPQNQNAGQEGRVGSMQAQSGNGEAQRQPTQNLKHGTEELRHKATEVARDATREGQAQVEQYRSVAAQKVDTIAESVKAAAAKLQEGDVGQWSTQIAGMADSMTRFSQGLRDKSADELMRDVNRLARENPAIFVGSAVAIGFGLTRVMRATAQPRPPKASHRSSASDGNSDDYRVTDRLSDDDLYSSSTISGGDSRNAGSTQGGSGYTSGTVGGSASGGPLGAAGAGTPGSGGTGTEHASGSAAGSGTSAGIGAGSGAQSSPAGFASAGTRESNDDARAGQNRWGDDDRGTSS